MGGVAVVTDNSAGIPDELVAELGIRIVPVDVLVDDVALTAGVSIDVAEAVKDGKKVTTSRPTPDAFVKVFESLARDGYEQIVVVTLSSKLSGTFDSAVIAARTSPIPVTVLDSRSIGLGLGFSVINAARTSQTGSSITQILEVVERSIASSQVFFYVNTLEYLKRGGRISPTSALLGTALSVKPIMTVVDGEVVLKEKVRTKAKALAELVNLAVQCARTCDPALIGLQYFGDRSLVDHCALMLAEQLPDVDLLISEVSPVIGVHAGPGLVGISVARGASKRIET
jgi:DegV family protein with EDD domain